MSIGYRPRWRNAIKGVRLSYDQSLGGGNIIAWGMGSQSRYSKPLLRPIPWNNLVPYVEPRDTGAFIYNNGEPAPESYTPYTATQRVAAEAAALLSEQQNAEAEFIYNPTNKSAIETAAIKVQIAANVAAAKLGLTSKGITAELAGSEMTPIYLSGTVAVIGILALIFKA